MKHLTTTLLVSLTLTAGCSMGDTVKRSTARNAKATGWVDLGHRRNALELPGHGVILENLDDYVVFIPGITMAELQAANEVTR